MNLTFEQILDIKCILSGKNKKDIAKSMDLNPVHLSQQITNKLLREAIDKYFENINPEINEVCNKLLKSDSDKVSEPNHKYGKPDDMQAKYIALQERLLKSQEERLKYLEAERKRIIEKYGDVYK